jgi:gliding motility-associated-like protein
MRYFYLLILSCLSLFKLEAQIDTSFWFVAPKVPAVIGTTSIGLQIGSYTQAVTVRVRQPANAGGVNLIFNLAANTSTLVDLTPSLGLVTSVLANAADNKGLYISSTGSVSANFIMESPVSKENISIKGRNGIGDDFFAPFTSSINTLYNGLAGNTAFDIVATEQGLTTLLITPKGNLIGPRPKNITFITTLTQGQTFSCQEDIFTRNPVSSVTRDFDGDGFLDIAMVDQKFNSVLMLKGNGTGSFTENGVHIVGSTPTHIIAADVNNDSNLDLIVTNSGSDNVAILIGNGAGSFAPATFFSTGGGQSPTSVACDDINNDGNRDLVVTHTLSSGFALLHGNGAGSFTFNSTYATAIIPIDIKISDFTNDGNKDVVISNFNSNSISVFTGVASGTFNTAPTNYACATNPYRLEVVDLNADGFEDVVVANRGSANVRVFLSNAVGTFTGITAYAVGTNPESVVTATVNGDGFRDLVVSNAGSNNVSVLFGAAAGAFGAAFSGNAVGTTPRHIVTGDFTGDGLPDFCTANFNSNNYSILTGNGTNAFAPINSTILGTVNYPFTELSGSIISSDKKIAVSVSGALGGASVCPSYYADQITPTSRIGMHYVVHRTGTQHDQTYILAPQNSTSLSITSATTTNWLINSGETFKVNTAGNALTYIQTDKPVYVFNVGGRGCKLAAAQIAPAYCAGSYTASFTRESSDSLFIDVYVRSAAIGTFTLDINSVPTPIAAGNFTVVPGTAGNLFGARIYFSTATIPLGAYCILRNNVDLFGFSVQNGGNATGSYLSQHSSFNSETFVQANPVPTATICSNTTFTLNGLIGGGPNTGVWTSNGYGTYSGGPNQIANNVYTPNLLDTSLVPVPTPTPWTGGLVVFNLTSTGICPNLSSTVAVRVLQGPIVNAGTDQIKCTNNTATIQLNGLILGASSQGTWSPVAPASGTIVNSSSLSTIYNTALPGDTALPYIKILLTSINNGICAAERDTIKIILQKAPIVDAAPTSSLVRCSNNSTVYLSGYISNSIPSGIWTTSGSGLFIPNNISLINNYVPSLGDLTTGPIKLKLSTPPSALCKVVSDSVIVHFTTPADLNLGPDLNSCKNNPIIPLNAVITGTSSSTVLWSGGTGSFVPSTTALTTTYIATPTETTSGFVILTASTTANGICLGVTKQIRIDFRDKPAANFITNTVCLNQTTLFSDQSINPSGIGSLSGWQWNFGNGQNSSNINPSLTYTAPGTYTVMLVVNNSFGCYDTIRKSTTVFPLPNIKWGYNRLCTGSAQNICFTDSSTILPPSTIPVTNHYWDFGGVGFSVTKDTCFIFPTDGKYSVTHQITSSNGCVSALVQTINITPKPTAKFQAFNSGQLSLGTNVNFIDSSKYSVGWTWDFGNGSTSTQQNPTTTYGSNGNYTVTQIVRDQFGCTDTYTLVVRILNVVNDIVQLIPNVISPNGDGKNDYWRLDFIDVYFKNAEIEIFNRWGESIFRSTGYSNAWDGTYRGEPLPVGAYYYTMDLKDPNKPGIIKGNITILK